MDKTILITGSRKGIGRYLIEYYVNKKYKVIGLSRGKSDFIADNYEHFCIDIGDEKDLKQVFKIIRKKYKQLDAVINCAAINPSVSHFILIPSDIIAQAYITNVFGLMAVCREAIKLMMRKKIGRIINFGSMAVKHEIIGDSIYASTKAAVNTFTRVLAKEVYNNGITCNVIAPAAIPSDMSVDMDQAILNEELSRNAIKNYGKMEDVSNITDLLLKEESNAITGQIIYLGGV